LPTTPTDADDIRIDIDRLETEAQTDDCRRDDSEKPFAPSGSATRMECAKSIKENCMKTTAGLWIDHRKAVIAIISGDGEETLEIQSNVEKQPGRLAGVRSTTSYESQKAPADDSHEREFMGHLNKYYDEVTAAIRGAESFLLFGPGEAKGELKKRLERDKLGGHIIAVETVDKMTDRQIAAKVREYFHKEGPGIGSTSSHVTRSD
jgi:hypothetical protein